MTQEQWLVCMDPAHMIDYLFFDRRVSDRKLRLFACACCRRIKRLIEDEDIPELLDLAEGFADGGVDQTSFVTHREVLLRRYGSVFAGLPEYHPADAAREAVLRAASFAYDTIPETYEDNDDAPYPDWAATFARYAVGGEQGEFRSEQTEGSSQVKLLNDIFGNPFRPVTVEPGWRTANVVELARTIYEERAFDRLPILANALMDAGCNDEQVLDHCRGPGPHVRGCWVVDLVLGKA